MRAVLGRPVRVRVRTYDEFGILADLPGSAVPTISVTAGDGTAVAVSGPVVNEAIGTYVATIPAQGELDTLVASWSWDSCTETELILLEAYRLVPLHVLKADPEIAALPNHDFIRLVDVVEDWFTDALGYPVAPICLRKVFNFPGGRRLRVPGAFFPRELVSAADGSVVLSQSAIDAVRVVDGAFEFDAVGSYDPIIGGCSSSWGSGYKSVRVVHGPPWDQPPADLQRAAVTLARYAARGSNYPERARSVTTEHSMITFATPDARHPTGLPDVDGAVTRYAIDSIV